MPWGIVPEPEYVSIPPVHEPPVPVVAPPSLPVQDHYLGPPGVDNLAEYK